MDRIKRLSYEVLETHKSKCGEDLADNKKVLDQVSIVRSKGLKNEIAGYITNYIKKEIREEKAKKAQAEASKSLEQEAQVEPEPVESTETTEATPETEAPAVESTETTEAPAAEPTPETTEEKSE